MGISLIALIRPRKLGLCSTTYASVLLLASANMIVMPVSARALDLDRIVRFNINQQPIGSALVEFSKQAHIQIVVSPDIADTVEAPPIHGTVPARAALDTLLRNTGLKYVATGGSLNIGKGSPGNGEFVERHDDFNDGTSFAMEMRVSPDELPVVQMNLRSDSSSPSIENERSDSTKQQLDEVVVTSRYQFLSADTSGTTNLPLPIEQVPQSISLVGSDFIKAADLKTLGEIAEYTPGAINVGNSENVGSLIKLRGFTAGQSIDGVPNQSGTQFEPDYAIYDRLEIVKGPSSVAYGVASPGGLVNYVTKSATAQTQNYLLAQAGNWNSYRLEGQIAGALDAEGDVRAIGIAVRDQGDSFLHEMYHKRTSVYGGLNVNFGNSVTAYVHGGYERQELPSFDGILAEPDGSPAPVPRSFFVGSRNIVTTTDVYHAEVGSTWHASDVMDVSIKGNYQRFSVGGAQGYAFGLESNGDFNFRATESVIRDSDYGIGLSSTYKLDNLGLRNSFVSLAALYQDHDGHSRYVSPDVAGMANLFDGEAAIGNAFDALLLSLSPVPYLHLETAKTLTFSGQSVLQLTDPLAVLLGVSYSKPKYSTANDGPTQDFNFHSKTSYRLGVTYELMPKTYAYVSYSQSFEPQGYLSVYTHGPLPPLTGEQYEGGLKFRSASGRALITGALFQIKEENAKAYVTTLPGVGDLYEPIGRVAHRGLELQAVGQIKSEWQINAGYAYLNPKIIEDQNPEIVGQTELFLPKQAFSLYTTYTLPNGGLRGLSFGGGARYVSSQRTSFDGSTKNLPGYSIVDATMGYAIDKWLVQLNAHNILDKHYFINNYQTLFYGNVVGDPANVSLSVRLQF